MARSWRVAVLALASGLFVAIAGIVEGSAGFDLLLALPFLVVAVLWSPLAFPRSISAAEAQQRQVADGRPIIYWRPGCPFCLRLRARIARVTGRASWVNIWSDPAGAAAVRVVTGGDETVPTVVTATGAFVNPDPANVRALLSAR